MQQIHIDCSMSQCFAVACAITKLNLIQLMDYLIIVSMAILMTNYLLGLGVLHPDEALNLNHGFENFSSVEV